MVQHIICPKFLTNTCSFKDQHGLFLHNTDSTILPLCKKKNCVCNNRHITESTLSYLYKQNEINGLDIIIFYMSNVRLFLKKMKELKLFSQSELVKLLKEACIQDYYPEYTDLLHFKDIFSICSIESVLHYHYHFDFSDNTEKLRSSMLIYLFKSNKINSSYDLYKLLYPDYIDIKYGLDTYLYEQEIKNRIIYLQNMKQLFSQNSRWYENNIATTSFLELFLDYNYKFYHLFGLEKCINVHCIVTVLDYYNYIDLADHHETTITRDHRILNETKNIELLDKDRDEIFYSLLNNTKLCYDLDFLASEEYCLASFLVVAKINNIDFSTLISNSYIKKQIKKIVTSEFIDKFIDVYPLEKWLSVCNIKLHYCSDDTIDSLNKNGVSISDLKKFGINDYKIISSITDIKELSEHYTLKKINSIKKEIDFSDVSQELKDTFLEIARMHPDRNHNSRNPDWPDKRLWEEKLKDKLEFWLTCTEYMNAEDIVEVIDYLNTLDLNKTSDRYGIKHSTNLSYIKIYDLMEKHIRSFPYQFRNAMNWNFYYHSDWDMQTYIHKGWTYAQLKTFYSNKDLKELNM